MRQMNQTKVVLQIPGSSAEKSLSLTLPASTIEVSTRSSIRSDMQTQICQNLRQPIDFPSLLDAVLQDDSVAVAVSAAVSELESLLASVTVFFLDANITPDRFSIVLSEHCRFDREIYISLLSEGLSAIGISVPDDTLREIPILVNDPTSDLFAYLAADKKGHPIHVNRMLLDADFLLPIVPIGSTFDIDGILIGDLIPKFCDAATGLRWNRKRLRMMRQSETSFAYVEELQWLLGLQVALAVSEDWNRENGTVLVASCQHLYEQAKSSSLIENHSKGELKESQAIDLVVIQMDRPGRKTDWETIAKSIVQASLLLENRGRILLCCEALPKVTEAISTLLDAIDLTTIQDELKPIEDANIYWAAKIADQMEQHSIFVYQSDSSAVDAGLFETINSVQQFESLTQSASQVALMS